jgi:hypothetical protein
MAKSLPIDSSLRLLAQPPAAHADAISITFAGNWAYSDIGDTSPTPIALENALGRLGIVAEGTSSQGSLPVGTELLFTKWVDPLGPISGGAGDAFLGGLLQIGSVSCSLGPSPSGVSDFNTGLTTVTGREVTRVWRRSASSVCRSRPRLPRLSS